MKIVDIIIFKMTSPIFWITWFMVSATILFFYLMQKWSWIQTWKSIQYNEIQPCQDLRIWKTGHGSKGEWIKCRSFQFHNDIVVLPLSDQIYEALGGCPFTLDQLKRFKIEVLCYEG